MNFNAKLNAATTATTTAGTQAPPKPDDTLSSIKDRVGNRGIGGRFVTWVKNATGITPKEQGIVNSFRDAIEKKVGSSEAAKVLFKEIGITGDRPLSARKAEAAINLAGKFVTDRDVTRKVDADKAADAAAKAATAKANAAKAASNNSTSIDPSLLAKVKFNPDTLSDSAIMLRSSIASKLGGTPAENAAAARKIITLLKLGDKEDITDAHIALATKLTARYEEARGSAFVATLGALNFNKFFGEAFGAVMANGNDPRAELLDTVELVALHLYTQEDFRFINSDLRTGNPSANTQVITNAVISGLEKLPPYKGLCYRGTSVPQGLDAAWQTGATIKDKGFCSSSASKDQAFPGAHQTTINSTKGRDISFLSHEPHEKEVLFPPDHGFKILDRRGTVDYGGSTDPGARAVNDANTDAPKWGQALLTIE